MKLALVLLMVAFASAAGISSAELQERLAQTAASPFVHLIFVYDSAAEMGPLMEQAITEIGKNKEGYFKTLPIDCNTQDKDVAKNFPYCSDDIRPKLPALMYTEPSLNPAKGDSQPKNHQYAGKLQEKALYEYAIPLMKLYSVQLKKAAEWQKFKESYPNTPKVLYFTDKDKISPFYKSLTAHFRNTIAFAHVFKNSSLCQELGVTTFPTMLLDGKERIELTSNLLEQVEILKPYEGEATQIEIYEFQELVVELNPENFQEKVLANPRHILIHVPAADGTAHPEWKKAQESFKKLFDYFEGTEVAKELGVKHKPAIVYYPKSLTKKQLKKTIFYSNNNFRAIYDEISGLIDDFTVPLSNQMELQQLTAIALNEGRFVAILFHKEDISLSYRVLSNDDKFKEGLDFFRMKNPEEEVLQSFNIRKLPSLLVMTRNDENQTKPEQKEGDDRKGMNLQIAEYKGKFNYDDLERFLNVFINKPKPEPEPQAKDLKEIKSKKQLDSQCEEQGCYLLLLDGSQQKRATNAPFVSSAKRIAAKVYQTVGSLDAKCHSQFLAPLQIYPEDLPAIIFLNTKFEKYSRLVGRIQEKAIDAFIQRVKANKASWRPYDRLKLDNKDCLKEHERLRELETSGYQMTAEEAEILQQIRQEQEKRKQQASATSGGESKKKRRRRRPKEEEDSQL